MEIEQKQTKNKIIFILAKLFPCQGKHNNIVLPWLLYIMQIILVIHCIIVSLNFPQTKVIIQFAIINEVILYVRIAMAIFYVVTKFKPVFMLCKMIGAWQLYAYNSPWILIPIIIQGIGLFIYYSCKQQRKYNFDSRLLISNGMYHSILLTFLQGLTILSGQKTMPSSLNKVIALSNISSSQVNLLSIFILTGFIFILTKTTFFYNLRTKRVLQKMWLGAVTGSLLCIFLKLNKVDAISIYIVVIIGSQIITVLWGILGQLQIDVKPLQINQFQNLGIYAKIQYLKTLIYLIEHKDQFKINGFIQYHFAQCKQTRCPISYYLSQDKPITFFHQCLCLYIKFILEKSYSESPIIRQINIFYRQVYDDHFLSFIRNDSVFHIRQKIRIKAQNKKKDDLDIETLNAFQQQENLIDYCKQYLKYYHSFLMYLEQQDIDLSVCERKSRKLIELRQKILQYLSSNMRLTETSIKLLKMMMEKVINHKANIISSQQFPHYVLMRGFSQPMIVVSAERQNLGKIVDSNAAGRALLGVAQQQMKTIHINQLLPQSFRQHHLVVLQKSSKRIQYDKSLKKINTLVFFRTKSGYYTVCKLQPHSLDGIQGKRWVCELQQIHPNKALVVLDQNGLIIGLTRNCINLQFTLDDIQCQLWSQSFQKIKNDTYIIGPDQILLQQHTFKKKLRWQLCHFADLRVINSSKKIKTVCFPQFYIFLVTDAEEKPVKNFNPFISSITDNTNSNPSNVSLYTKIMNTKTNDCIPSNKSLKLQINVNKQLVPSSQQISNFAFGFNSSSLTYRDENVSQAQNFPGFLTKDNSPWAMIKQIANNKINYGLDINQMIYINGKLQFRQNKIYDTDCEWESLPNYKEQQKKSFLKPIQLNCFSQTMNSILATKPKQIKILSIIFSLSGFFLIFLIVGSLIFRVIQAENEITHSIFNKNLLELEKKYIYLGNNLMRQAFISNGFWNMSRKNINKNDIFQQFNSYEEKMINSLSQYSTFVNQPLSFRIDNFNYINQIKKDIQIRLTIANPYSNQNVLSIINLINNGVYRANQQYKNKAQQLFNSKNKQLYTIGSIYFLTCAFFVILVIIGIYLYINKVLNQKKSLLKICGTFSSLDIEKKRINIGFLKKNFQLFLQDQEQDQQYLALQEERIQQQKNHINSIKKKLKLSPTAQGRKFYLLLLFNFIGLLLGVAFFFIGKAFLSQAQKYQTFHKIFNPVIEKLSLIDLKGKNQYLQSQYFTKTLNRYLINSQIDTFTAQFNEISQKFYIFKQQIKQNQQFSEFTNNLHSQKICDLLQIGNRCKTDRNGYLGLSLNQLVVQFYLLQRKLFNEFYGYSLDLALQINQISDVYIQKLVDIGTQRSNNELMKQYKKVESNLILIGCILIGIFMLGIILGVIWINKKKSFIQEPLNILVNLIPLEILINNYHFKKWYYEKFKQQVY